jgi:hypothetical protein
MVSINLTGQDGEEEEAAAVKRAAVGPFRGDADDYDDDAAESLIGAGSLATQQDNDGDSLLLLSSSSLASSSSGGGGGNRMMAAKKSFTIDFEFDMLGLRLKKVRELRRCEGGVILSLFFLFSFPADVQTGNSFTVV